MSPTFDRAALIADPALGGRAFVDAYTAAVDDWLRELFELDFGDAAGVALIATGGQGRGEMTPGSDLDLLLAHDGGIDPEAAQRLWYPIWDAGMKLGHSVRTVGETLALARSDLATATSLLSGRCLAGDARLAEELSVAARAQWVKGAKRSLRELADAVDARQSTAGEVAFALEPDLKVLLPDSMPEVRTFDRIEALFGGVDTVYFCVTAKNGTIWDAHILSQIHGMSKKIKTCPNVDRILSITEMKSITNSNDIMEVSSIIPEGETTIRPEDVGRIRDRIRENDMA